jgi:hypothetical protein
MTCLSTLPRPGHWPIKLILQKERYTLVRILLRGSLIWERRLAACYGGWSLFLSPVEAPVEVTGLPPVGYLMSWYHGSDR